MYPSSAWRGTVAGDLRESARFGASRRESGFTLIEISVVAMIIAIVAAIAIPNLQSARKAGNEANTVGYIKACISAQEQYRTRFGSYASSEVDLFNAGFLDPAQNPSGYNMVGYVTTGWTYQVGAQPQQPGVTGDRNFFVDNSGVIRFAEGAPATAASPPIDG